MSYSRFKPTQEVVEVLRKKSAHVNFTRRQWSHDSIDLILPMPPNWCQHTLLAIASLIVPLLRTESIHWYVDEEPKEKGVCRAMAVVGKAWRARTIVEVEKRTEVLWYTVHA